MDYKRLSFEMKARKISITTLCRDAKISRSALYRKCRGISEFTLDEINRIIGVLDEVQKVENPLAFFFGKKVS